ncbi:aminophospholipid-translocating P4-type ATPase NEO1 SCDLUD_000355 [Saccharomycodes ludwigii]|uniref:aminophospholipid-translocating P4-type ATPase NEO1 n=1 Tax=Saccharomycodes ludwigii TaxID=36035 RepID=UPI001E865089|nr:hypothetical protein SCDLUD_000355 [Saccharomycodes ludwigii]KAH3902766.1 hypothetical protein SCDLUD_000355 [Saccharomycodes ludwigii]
MSFAPPPGSTRLANTQLSGKNNINSSNNNNNNNKNNINKKIKQSSHYQSHFDESLEAALDSLELGDIPDSGRSSVESFELHTLNNNNNTSQSNKNNSTNNTSSTPDYRENVDLSTTNTNNNTDNNIIKSKNISIPNFISMFFSRVSAKQPYSKIELSEGNVEREIQPHTTPVFDRNKYPSNAISNAKYNPITFVPIILYEQFKFFFNLYFLLVALSQTIPALRIGYLSSYVLPLAFVLAVTMSKEALDDIQRRKRDKESNNELYEVINQSKLVPSKDLKVGDLVKLHKGIRIPADMILLQSSEASGETFIKTDQLDGETDWKLRVSCPVTQKLSNDQLINNITIVAEVPHKSIHTFTGKLTFNETTSHALTVDNALWANTVLASTGTCIGCVIYTGSDTRQAMNTTTPKVKTGLLELEINNLSKILCLSVFILSILLVLFAGFDNPDWYIDVMRYLILFSSIIPVSLRVNLDLGKSVYAYQIEHDTSIPETIVRTSTIPEDLGRIEYLLSDKTGTLTQNDMELKKLHLGTIAYTQESFDLLRDSVSSVTEGVSSPGNVATSNIDGSTIGMGTNKINSRRNINQRVYDMLITLALCHNVTPTFEDNGELSYQAASPDEIAIVKFTQEVGLSLFKRDRESITLYQEASKSYLEYKILYVFPFNSDTKRMGIIVKSQSPAQDDYWFLEKGADTVMTKIVASNDWLEEETGNMAREGLRTLVIGRKKLSASKYKIFSSEYEKASLSMINRDEAMSKCITKYLEHDLELLGLTGVEDKLQKDVKTSIELLRNAGVKIWMLTGDKVETAKCVSISAKLISRGQYVHTIIKKSKPEESALSSLEYLTVNKNAVLIIDGESLGMYLTYYREEFFNAVIQLPAVVACRCTPQQKADVAMFIRQFTGKRVCCIGDGGNDVSMIQSADVGVGIVGKEGKQASLAADFSISQFCHLTKLLLWHGRNSYKRSAKLAQFVMHRGLIISVCQALYSICSSFEPIALFQGWLMVGYSTCYTMAPVFSLTTDHDIDESLAIIYPELYKELTEGKSLSYKTFFSWCLLSLFQGIVIQGFAQKFTSILEIDFTKMVALSFTVLVMNELTMVALEIKTWNKTMAIAEILTFICYFVTVPFLGEYFNLEYVLTVQFLIQMALILGLSIIPVWIAKAIYRKFNLPTYVKVQQFST